MRAAVAEVMTSRASEGWDYVLIGKAEATAARDFTDLQNDLRYALRKVHGGGR